MMNWRSRSFVFSDIKCGPTILRTLSLIEFQVKLMLNRRSAAESATMSNSSLCSMDSNHKKMSLAKMSKTSTNNSTRSSVSSMTSNSSMCSNSLPTSAPAGAYSSSSNLNHALAVVTNQLEREQRKHDQEATRKLTLLRQRKISAVLKVNLNFGYWVWKSC